ncbi:hypothetical protein GCM10023116_48380 [Kistimonas scapharcae]|uniref:TMhelix containing protein n=1 Tax=Kistimonas scapharcae TaxID=1036133 RepID=A0ABP8V9C4_9GAMM
MVELLTAAAGGSITGIIGSLIGRVFGYLEKREEIKEKKLEFDQELKLIQYQGKIEADEREDELALTVEQNDMMLQHASYQHDSAIGEADRWVINILRLVRPVLTLLLIVLAGYISIAGDFEQSDIDGDIVYLATMAVSWWFGDRGKR